MTGSGRGVAIAWVIALVAAGAGLSLLFGQRYGEVSSPRVPRPEAASPEQLFRRDCATCHGPQGEGTSQGPPIADSGAAAVDFYVRTGRMPLAHPRAPVQRGEPAYTEAQIEELVAYAATFVSGPEVPRVTTDTALQPEGGQLFRLNCASCHQFAGNGGVLYEDREAPTLHFSTPLEVAEAIRVGPGTMPQFGVEALSDEEVDAIASYIIELQHPRDPGGVALVHYGPFSEGFVAWAVGIGGLLVALRWIGKRT